MRWFRRSQRGASGTVIGIGAAVGLLVAGGIVADAHRRSGGLTITTCGTLTTAGSYVLTADLSTVSNQCMVINASNVTIDCQGHKLLQFTINNGNNDTINNCVMDKPTFSLANNTSHFSIFNSQFNGSDLQIKDSDFADVGSNTITNIPNFGGGITIGNDGNGSVIHDNTISSTATSSTAGDGGDSGIFLEALTQPVSNVEIRNNTISRFFGRGIEFYSANDHINFHDNAIDHTYESCIGGFFWFSLQDSNLATNTCDTSPTLYHFWNNTGAPLDGTVVNWKNNTIDGNTLTNRLAVGSTSASIDETVVNGTAKLQSTGATESRTITFSVSGNVIKNNLYGASGFPLSAPSSGFSDGGGNHCNNFGNNANTAPVVCLAP